MSNPLRDMEKPEAIFCIGTNMTECHPVAATRIKRAIAKGARMVVADPVALRLQNMIQPDEFPHRIGSGIIWDQCAFNGPAMRSGSVSGVVVYTSTSSRTSTSD